PHTIARNIKPCLLSKCPVELCVPCADTLFLGPVEPRLNALAVFRVAAAQRSVLDRLSVALVVKEYPQERFLLTAVGLKPVCFHVKVYAHSASLTFPSAAWSSSSLGATYLRASSINALYSSSFSFFPTAPCF